MNEDLGLSGLWIVEAYSGQDGRLLWRDVSKNLIVTTGRNALLDNTFNASGYTSAWYIGLTGNTPSPAAGDTMGSHAGWTEVTAYDEATRQAYDPAAASSGSLTNTASKAIFTISSNDTALGGVFCTSNNTKGGSTGTLFNCVAFSTGNQTLHDNDVLHVTLVVSLTAS